MNNWMRIGALCVAVGLTASLAHADSITAGTTVVQKDNPAYDPADPASEPFIDVTVPTTIVTFSFETAPVGALFGPGESIVFNVGAYELRVSRPGSFFTFTNLAPYTGLGVPDGPDGWGSVSLDPFVDYLNPAPFLFEITALPTPEAVMKSKIEYGDFGPSDDDYITGEVNALLENETTDGFSTATLGSLARIEKPATGPFFETGATGGSITEEGVKDHTLWWDNFTITVVAADDLPDTLVAPVFSYVSNTFIPGYIPGLALPTQPTPIPEPGTWALLSGGLLAVFALRRRRR